MKLRCAALSLLFMAFLLAPVACQETDSQDSNYDWMGTPIYGYTGPYPGMSSSFVYPNWNYAQEYNYYDPYWNGLYWTYPYSGTYYPQAVAGYPTGTWWWGEHRGLPKTLDIARTRSSVRVYWAGSWQPL